MSALGSEADAVSGPEQVCCTPETGHLYRVATSAIGQNTYFRGAVYALLTDNPNLLLSDFPHVAEGES